MGLLVLKLLTVKSCILRLQTRLVKTAIRRDPGVHLAITRRRTASGRVLKTGHIFLGHSPHSIAPERWDLSDRVRDSICADSACRPPAFSGSRDSLPSIKTPRPNFPDAGENSHPRERIGR